VEETNRRCENFSFQSFARVAQQQRHDVENVDSAGALRFAIANNLIWETILQDLGGPTPAASILMESKPQQTGTGFLLRFGEVATTSGSTFHLPGRLISRTSPFDGERVGASPAPAANFTAQNGCGKKPAALNSFAPRRTRRCRVRWSRRRDRPTRINSWNVARCKSRAGR
jgi:hypothetical protein